MRKHIFFTAVAALSFSGLAHAQNRRVDRMLDRQFPNQRHEIIGENKVNGTTVYDVRVTGDRGEAGAQITVDGDFLSTSSPISADRLPPTAAEVLEAMRGGRPDADRDRDVQRIERTYFQLDLDLGHRPVRVEFDAAGRLHRILNHRQMHEADAGEGLERTDRRGEESIAEFVHRYFDNSHIRAVYRSPEGEGFYVVKLTADRENRPVTAVMSDRGDISNWQIEVDPREVPRAVMDAVHEAFGNVEIERTMRSMTDYYRVERPIGGDRVAIDVKPSGEILRVEGETYRFDDRWHDRRGDVPRIPDRDRDRDRR